MFLLSALALACATLVAATPLLPRQLQKGPDCALNAMGRGVSIQINDTSNRHFELGVHYIDAGAPLTAFSSIHGWEQPDFLLQQNGQAKPSYIIKDVSDHNLALTFLGQSNRATLEQASDSSTDVTQLWDFSCDFCDPNAATRPSGVVLGGVCTMHPHNYPDYCVGIGFPMRTPPYPVVTPCDVSRLQFFNVVIGD
ncbi:hypothetical protein VKT23_014716 [Stygiomarasmius scandens]|uniref:Cellobiose dehydrogenase cytochrome domain-containing protein n=1 Tax=Marasmiellus scandens TaxID=2682957 RepID=A0ABR1IZY6_9AGAR